MDDLMWNRGPIGGPFALIDHTGKLRTDEDFRGKLPLIYFGYSYCPDVCPTDLQQIGLCGGWIGRPRFVHPTLAFQQMIEWHLTKAEHREPQSANG